MLFYYMQRIYPSIRKLYKQNIDKKKNDRTIR